MQVFTITPCQKNESMYGLFLSAVSQFKRKQPNLLISVFIYNTEYNIKELKILTINFYENRFHWKCTPSVLLPKYYTFGSATNSFVPPPSTLAKIYDF